VRRVFCPVATETTNRLAPIGDVISLRTSDRPSAVHAIVFSRSGTCVSAIFRSPPPSGEVTKTLSSERLNAMERPSGDHAGACSGTEVLVSCTSASLSTCLTKMSPFRSNATWLPSGERLGGPSTPGYVVNGTSLEAGGAKLRAAANHTTPASNRTATMAPAATLAGRAHESQADVVPEGSRSIS
jgi:hypothetical protein